ncbi:hypothetical protein [Myxococcus xanthus]|uniref:hypothetical protein n=1 Tax=Myxococcus xanthus TaxID=34 RepID=UPI001163E926|nr:hypothetical protein [Myxococcus xanthus]QDE94455.1 hypothetical protein BHS05_00395 [Myxococcus xanthus]QDF01679.1 hypothetical protein BHS04_00390 [Myxococcus xanthus]
MRDFVEQHVLPLEKQPDAFDARENLREDVVARVRARAREEGLRAFLFDADQPGWRIKRRIPIMGPEEHGGHCEIVFDGLEIPDAHRLLDVGDGQGHPHWPAAHHERRVEAGPGRLRRESAPKALPEDARGPLPR